MPLRTDCVSAWHSMASKIHQALPTLDAVPLAVAFVFEVCSEVSRVPKNSKKEEVVG